jgi:hypothetical protein
MLICRNCYDANLPKLAKSSLPFLAQGYLLISGYQSDTTLHLHAEVPVSSVICEQTAFCAFITAVDTRHTMYANTRVVIATCEVTCATMSVARLTHAVIAACNVARVALRLFTSTPHVVSATCDVTGSRGKESPV